MSLACFVRTVESVEVIDADNYSVSLTCQLTNAEASVITLSFTAQKGADWRIQCRTALQQYLQDNFSETLDLVILPGLDTI